MANEKQLQTTNQTLPDELKQQQDIIKALVLHGDVSKMTDVQKVEYYNRFCASLGLNPLTQPFQIITFKGKERLYATKDCTEQLRKIHGVSVESITHSDIKDVHIVTAIVKDRAGRTDASTGAISVANLKGEDLANALMKAETKAKRRATLSICGLGMLDETELETIPENTIAAKITINEEVVEIPQELKDVIADADLDNLGNIYRANTELHSNKEFMALLAARKQELKQVTQS